MTNSWNIIGWLIIGFILFIFIYAFWLQHSPYWFPSVNYQYADGWTEYPWGSYKIKDNCLIDRRSSKIVSCKHLNNDEAAAYNDSRPEGWYYLYQAWE